MYEPLSDLACADPTAAFVHEATLLGEKGGHLFTRETEQNYHDAGGVIYPCVPCANSNTINWQQDKSTASCSAGCASQATPWPCPPNNYSSSPTYDGSVYTDATRIGQQLRQLLSLSHRFYRAVCGTAASVLPVLRIIWPTAVVSPRVRLAACSSSATVADSCVLPNSSSGPIEQVCCMAFHPYRMLLAVVVREDSWTHRARVNVYDVAESCAACVLTHAFQREVHCVAWKPHARGVLAVGCRGGVLMWCVEAGGVRPAASGRGPARWLRLRPGATRGTMSTDPGGSAATMPNARPRGTTQSHDDSADSRTTKQSRNVGLWERWRRWVAPSRSRCETTHADLWGERVASAAGVRDTLSRNGSSNGTVGMNGYDQKNSVNTGLRSASSAGEVRPKPRYAVPAMLEVSAQAHTDETAWALFYPSLQRRLPVTALAFTHGDGRYLVCGSRYTTRVSLLDIALPPHDPAHECWSITPSLDGATEQILIADDDSFIVTTLAAHPSLTFTPIHHCCSRDRGSNDDRNRVSQASSLGTSSNYARTNWTVKRRRSVTVAVPAPVRRTTTLLAWSE